jgi:hypothetical protein
VFYGCALSLDSTTHSPLRRLSVFKKKRKER